MATMDMNPKPTLLDRVMALTAHGHSPLAVASHLEMTEDEMLDIVNEDPEVSREYEIAKGKGVFRAEAAYLDEMMRPSTRNLLSELSARHPDFWGKTAAPRSPSNPYTPNDAGAIRIAPSNDDLFTYDETEEAA